MRKMVIEIDLDSTTVSKYNNPLHAVIGLLQEVSYDPLQRGVVQLVGIDGESVGRITAEDHVYKGKKKDE